MDEGGGFTRRRDCRRRRARGPEFRSPRADTVRRTSGTHMHAHAHAHACTPARTSRGRIACDRKISRDLINVRLTKSNLINIAADWRRHLASDPRERERAADFLNWEYNLRETQSGLKISGIKNFSYKDIYKRIQLSGLSSN